MKTQGLRLSILGWLRTGPMWHGMILCAVLALMVRTATAMTGGHFGRSPLGDERLFDPIARHLAAGEGYTIDGSAPTAIRPPVYPAVLAAVYAVTGESRGAGRVLNLLLASVTAGLVVLLGNRILGHAPGMLSGLAVAVYPGWIDVSMRLLSDTLYVLLVVVLLLQIHRAESRPAGLGRWLAAGLLLGACILTRSESLLLLPIMGGGLLLAGTSNGRRVGPATALVVPAALLVGLWVIRNRVQLGRPALSTNMGQVMWGVYHPRNFSDDASFGTWQAPEPSVWNTGQYAQGSRGDAGTYLAEPDYNSRQISWALESIRGHVTQLPRMMLVKLNRYFLSRGDAENLARFFLVFFFLCGELALVIAGDARAAWSLHAVIAANLLVALLFYADVRLRMPGDMVLILLASSGFVWVVNLLFGRRTREVLA